MNEEEQEFDERKFFRSPDTYGFFTLDRNWRNGFSLSATGSYTGKMLVPYFGPEIVDPEEGELRKPIRSSILGSRQATVLSSMEPT